MAKDEQVNGGANRTALVQQVNKTFKQYAQLENQRAEINAGMGEIRAKWERMGLSKKGIKAGLSRAKLDGEQRELFDESYDLAADALGMSLNISPDFFDDPDLFNPEAADKEPNEDGDPDGEGQEQEHLTEEEIAAAAEAMDEAEQEEGDAVLTEMSPETQAAQGLATKH